MGLVANTPGGSPQVLAGPITEEIFDVNCANGQTLNDLQIFDALVVRFDASAAAAITLNGIISKALDARPLTILAGANVTITIASLAAGSAAANRFTGAATITPNTGATYLWDRVSRTWNPQGDVSAVGADPIFTAIAAGDVPASGGGTANFIRADGTWAVPPGTASPLNPIVASIQRNEFGFNVSNGAALINFNFPVTGQGAVATTPNAADPTAATLLLNNPNNNAESGAGALGWANFFMAAHAATLYQSESGNVNAGGYHLTFVGGWQTAVAANMNASVIEIGLIPTGLLAGQVFNGGQLPSATHNRVGVAKDTVDVNLSFMTSNGAVNTKTAFSPVITAGALNNHLLQIDISAPVGGASSTCTIVDLDNANTTYTATSVLTLPVADASISFNAAINNEATGADMFLYFQRAAFTRGP